MSVPIRQNLVSTSKHPIKAPHTMTPRFITVHNTANDASANNEIAYMIRNDNQVSFHFAVDDIEVVQGLPLNRNGWHSGDGNGSGNRQSIGVEICYSKSGGTRFTKAEQNGAWLVAKLMKDHNIPLANVRTHQSWNGKVCPHRTLSLGWERFLNRVQAEFNKTGASTASHNSNNNHADRYTVSRDTPGFLTAADALNHRNQRGTVRAGDYHVFNRSQGMINVTSKQGIAGSWINPSGTTSTTQYYPAPSNKNLGLVDSFKAINVDSSFANRARIAQANGISGYSGSAPHNTQMLTLLRQGKLIRP